MEISYKNNSKSQIPCGLFLLSFHLLLFQPQNYDYNFSKLSKNSIASYTFEKVRHFLCNHRFRSSMSSNPGSPSAKSFSTVLLAFVTAPDNNFTRNLCCQSFFSPLLHLLNFQIRSCSIFSCQITFSNIVSCLCSKICHTIKLR